MSVDHAQPHHVASTCELQAIFKLHFLVHCRLTLLLLLQYASLLNSFASFAAAPAIISYSSASPIARVAVATSVLAFALITTGGLHWFTKPYVHQLLYNKQVRWR
jgi:hypothetical protein